MGAAQPLANELPRSAPLRGVFLPPCAPPRVAQPLASSFIPRASSSPHCEAPVTSLQGFGEGDAAKTCKVPALESPRCHQRGVGHLGGSVWRKSASLWSVVLIWRSPCELNPSAEAQWRRHLSCLVLSLVGGRNRPPLSPSSCPEQVDVPYSPLALPPFTSPAFPSIPPAIQAPSASLLRGTGPAPATSSLGMLTACAAEGETQRGLISRPRAPPVPRCLLCACSHPGSWPRPAPGPGSQPRALPSLSRPLACQKRDENRSA